MAYIGLHTRSIHFALDVGERGRVGSMPLLPAACSVGSPISCDYVKRSCLPMQVTLATTTGVVFMRFVRRV